MLISTDAGAGEIVRSGEETRFYDDIRCLAADWVHRREPATAFVHLGDGSWSDAAAASYGQSVTARTAMGSGLTAFASDVQARAADRSGRSLTWDDVVRLAGERP